MQLRSNRAANSMMTSNHKILWSDFPTREPKITANHFLSFSRRLNPTNGWGMIFSILLILNKTGKFMQKVGQCSFRLLRSSFLKSSSGLFSILWALLLSLSPMSFAQNGSKNDKAAAPAKAVRPKAESGRSKTKNAANKAISVEQRFFKALKSINAKSEEAEIQMTIIEPDGSTKEREVAVRRITVGKEQRVLVRILAPADLKGMALLSIVDKSSENQWIYFPSSKQTRKVVQSDRSESGVLGSELQYADFDPEVIRGSSAKLLRTEPCGRKTCDVVEANPPKDQSPYSKVIGYLEKGRDLPMKMEYFKGEKKIKTVEFQDYKAIAKVLRPRKLTIRNHENKRGTDIILASTKVNSGLKPDDITLQKISRPW